MEVLLTWAQSGLPCSVCACYRLPTDWFWLLDCVSATCARPIDFSLYYYIVNFVLFYCVFIIDLVTILGYFIDVVFFDGVHCVALFGSV